MGKMTSFSDLNSDYVFIISFKQKCANYFFREPTKDAVYINKYLILKGIVVNRTLSSKNYAYRPFSKWNTFKL